jgi:two-component system LytT family response regulator
VSNMIVPILRTIIADDEALARKKLRVLLSAEAGVHVVAECDSGKQTLQSVLAHRPDMDGFQLLDQIPAEQLPLVVFTTAYDQYAIRAFESQALDYLLKPFNQERLHRALERAKTELVKSHEESVKARLLDLLRGTRPNAKPLNRLVIRTAGRVVFLDMQEIDWIEAAANYVKLHAGKDSFLLREGIGRLEAKLDSDRFVRIHRSFIVNTSRIRELQPCDSGEYIAVLKDGKELSCSRGCRAQLQKLIDGSL